MGMVLTEEQGLLLDSARNFISDRAPLSAFRALRDSGEPAGFDQALWSQMAQMGWAGLTIPEAHGGFGFGFQGLGLVMEEAGRTLTASPLLSTVALGASALLHDQVASTWKDSLLPAVAAGEMRLALAIDEGAHHAPTRVTATARRAGGGYMIDGQKTMVVDGLGAQHLIVSARTAGGAEDAEGISLFLVDASTPGLRWQATSSIDARSLPGLRLEGVQVPADNLLGQEGHGFAILDHALDRGRIALSAEMLGGAQNAFDITLAYLKERTQFGQTIGQFQALQHRAAIMYAELELLRSVVTEAVSAVDEAPAQVPLMASLAKTKANDVLHLVSREGIQMHGGIGMTDAHDIGFFIKRGAVAECLLGDSRFHRARYAALSGF